MTEPNQNRKPLPPRAYPPDGGLKEPVRPFSETFSADTVVFEHFFGQKQRPDRG